MVNYRLHLLLVFFILSSSLFAQKIKVLNKETKEPISDAFIYNMSKKVTAISDSSGVLDISEFPKKDTLVFTHQGFATFMIPKINIGTTIYLKKAVQTIPTFDIIANEDKEKAIEVTSTIDKIDRKTVQFNNPQTSAEMLELSSGVYLQKSQMGGGSPIIRGFEANRVLLVVDGVRMNNAIYRSGHLQNAITIDNSIIENTEVIYGSNSIVYGSDAIGGVVHFETVAPQFRNETDTINNNSANAYARYATANQEKTAHFDFNLGWKKIASVTSATFSDFGDLRMGETPNNDYPDFGVVKFYADRIDNKDTTLRKENFYKQIGTAYSQTDLLQKISYKVSDKFLLTLNAQYSTSSNVPRYDQLSDFSDDGNLKWAEWYYGPQNRILSSLSARILSDNKWFSKVEILPHFQKIDEDRVSRRFGDSLKTYREEDVNVYGLNIDFVKDNNLKSQWYYGVELNHNIVESLAYNEDILTGNQYSAATRYPDNGSTYSSAAAYVTFKNNFTEKATYSLGTRYTYTSLLANFADTTFVKLPFDEISTTNGAVTGSAGISFHPNKKFRIYSSVSTGFRTPNVDDVGKVFAKRDYVMIPNDQVKPEYSYNGELGFSKTFGDNQDLIISAVGFYTLLQNAIVRDFYSINGVDSMLYEGDTLQIQTNVNANEATVYGTTFNIQANFSNDVTIKSSFTYTLGRNTTLDVPLGHIPPFYGRTDIILKSDPLTVNVYAKYQGWKWISDYSPFGDDNEDKATANGTPAWQTFNIRVDVQLNKSFSFQAALENLLDVHYRPFASGVSGAGRNFILTLRADI